MRIVGQRITIINIRKPTGKNINQELQWFGSSLGLFGLRDKDKSCFRIFIELLKSAKNRKAMSSNELARQLNLSRGTVIHHINRLMEAGIVVNDHKKYILRVENLQTLVEEIEEDVKRSCKYLREIAQDIDKQLGL
jgi:predicted transcriptional regulator